MTTKTTRKSAPPAAKPQASSARAAKAPRDAKVQSKADAIIALLKREGGATLDEMMQATGWQKHSLRGFMAGALKKRHGLTVTSAKTDQGRTYRVTEEAQQ